MSSYVEKHDAREAYQRPSEWSHRFAVSREVLLSRRAQMGAGMMTSIPLLGTRLTGKRHLIKGEAEF